MRGQVDVVGEGGAQGFVRGGEGRVDGGRRVREGLEEGRIAEQRSNVLLST